MGVIIGILMLSMVAFGAAKTIGWLWIAFGKISEPLGAAVTWFFETFGAALGGFWRQLSEYGRNIEREWEYQQLPHTKQERADILRQWKMQNHQVIDNSDLSERETAHAKKAIDREYSKRLARLLDSE